ncbi:response regulator [Desulfothermus okinawensis JCM 13304]
MSEKKAILIVDDSKTVRNLVSFVIKKAGFKVVVAEDGLDGLEKLYSNPDIVLVVSDVNMPRMDGLTFIKNIREQEAFRDLPIIILSTEGEDKDIQAGLEVGADIYMVKPAQPHKLLKNINMLLGKKK